MAGRMRSRHEPLLATLISLAHVILDDRVAAGEAALVPETVEHTLGRMALLARHLQVFLQPMLDGCNESIQLGPPDRQLTLITGRCRIRHPDRTIKRLNSSNSCAARMPSFAYKKKIYT